MKKTTLLKNSSIKLLTAKKLNLSKSFCLRRIFFYVLALIGSLGLFAQQYHLKTNIQGWKAASGAYVNDVNYIDGENGENTAIIITPSYQVKPNAKMKNEDGSDFSIGYIQLKAKNNAATIIFPPYTGVKSFKIDIIAGGANRKITLFNGIDSLTTFEDIGKTGDTYTYDVPDSEQGNTFNFILKDQTNLLYICDIEIEKIAGSAVVLPRSISKLYSNEGEICFEAREGENVEVYSILGQLVYKAVVHNGLNSIRLRSGVYIVKVGSTAEKVFVE